MTLDTPFQVYCRQPLSTSYVFFMRTMITVVWNILNFFPPLTASPCSRRLSFHFIEFRTSNGARLLQFLSFDSNIQSSMKRWKKRKGIDYKFWEVVTKRRLSIFRPSFEKNFRSVDVWILTIFEIKIEKNRFGSSYGSFFFFLFTKPRQLKLSTIFRSLVHLCSSLHYQIYYYVDLQNLQTYMYTYLTRVVYLQILYYRWKLSFDHSLNASPRWTEHRIRNNYTSHAVWQWGR